MTYIINDNGIDRPMTFEEQNVYEQAQQEMLADAQVLEVEKEIKAQARQTVLNRLGLTEEEAQLLLGGN